MKFTYRRNSIGLKLSSESHRKGKEKGRGIACVCARVCMYVCIYVYVWRREREEESISQLGGCDEGVKVNEKCNEL